MLAVEDFAADPRVVQLAEARVREAVVADAVPGRVDLPEGRSVPEDVAAEDEEGRPDAEGGEAFQHQGRHGRVGPVVEGEFDTGLARGQSVANESREHSALPRVDTAGERQRAVRFHRVSRCQRLPIATVARRPINQKLRNPGQRIPTLTITSA